MLFSAVHILAVFTRNCWFLPLLRITISLVLKAIVIEPKNQHPVVYSALTWLDVRRSIRPV